MYEIKPCILPEDILNAGVFYFNCDFERDTEIPYGYFASSCFIMSKDCGKWHYIKKQDFYIDGEHQKKVIENQINLVKDCIGNPYFIKKVKREDAYKIRVAYNILLPNNYGNQKIKHIKPSDCRVIDTEQHANIKNIPYIPDFVKQKVHPWGAYVTADYDFNTDKAANYFYEEMKVLIQMGKVWHISDNLNTGR